MIAVRNIIRVAPQVTKVLHQHEGAVEFTTYNIRMFSNDPQHLRSAHTAAGKIIDQLIAFNLREWIAGVVVKSINKFGGTHRVRESRCKTRALDEFSGERLFVVLQDLLPVRLTDNDSLSDLLGVGQKLIKPNRRHQHLMGPAQR